MNAVSGSNLHANEKLSHREYVYWLVCARSHKYIDPSPNRPGYAIQQHGATICAINNPQAESEAGFVTCLDDLAEPAESTLFGSDRGHETA